MRRLLEAFGERTDRPVLLKLPPFTSDEDRAAVLDLARTAVEAGARGLVCSNTIPMEEPRLAAGRGGLSGGPLTELTPRIVADVAAATGGSVPIVGCGGIFTAEDVRRCLDAGATAVQLYTSLIYRGPGIVGAAHAGPARGTLRRARTAGQGCPLRPWAFAVKIAGFATPRGREGEAAPWLKLPSRSCAHGGRADGDVRRTRRGRARSGGQALR